MSKPDNIRNDRAGGTSASSSANPPAITPSLESDIAYLESRGIDCAPAMYAKRMLLCLTRHRIDAYIHFVLNNKRSIRPNIKEIFDVITFDRRIQSIALKYIGVLESKFRSIYSRLLVEESGEYAIYDPNVFLRYKNYSKMRESYDREMTYQSKNKAFARHKDSNGRIPLSVAVEYLSLGCLSKMYGNTASVRITTECAEVFNINKKKMTSWLKTLTAVRNCCAHFNPYVVRRQIPATPLPIRGDEKESRDPFYIFRILETMLEDKLLSNDMDHNLNIPLRIFTDLQIDVSQFLWLHDFNMSVADYLKIPEVYRPVQKEQNGQAGYLSAIVSTDFTPCDKIAERRDCMKGQPY